MIDNQITLLLQKLTNQTKLGEIEWINLDYIDYDLKPFPPDRFEKPFSFSFNTANPDFSKSYFSEHRKGSFFLFFYDSSTPLESNSVLLAVDTEKSKYLNVLISSNEGAEYENEIVALKRLYNLVENNTSDAYSFINDYLSDF